MVRQDVRLDDRFDLSVSPVVLNGTQALVRLMLMQAARDRAAGHRTAGYVTGYRGSPLGSVDVQMTRAKRWLDAAEIRFQPGLNEDLAATALWGTQGAGLRGEGRFDGVFGLWYGKGPGVDRSGDAFRHANLAGTAPLGGVVAALGDDHTGESSTTCHQSDWAAMDAWMPVLSPAGVQEILDFGLYGFALSRFSGLWAGLKLSKDTVEATAVVDGRPDRMAFVRPDFALPPGGLSIRPGDHWVAQEARLIEWKRPAAEAFARANGIDRRGLGGPGARIGLVAAGKNWLDLVHALSLLGIGEGEARALGLTAWKVGQVWPLDARSLRDWAEGLDLVVVVEEKRKIIEAQVKEALYDRADRPRVWGGRRGGPEAPVMFPATLALDPAQIAVALGEMLLAEGRESEGLRARLTELKALLQAETGPALAVRPPYFCAGCPHNTSTRLPEGARAGGGIGCHTLALWMDRRNEGLTQMGGEGANWVGEAPFSTRPHMFQNMGDGTYNHSGLLAIRHAVGTGTNITYKILCNDAVAMTGGQGNDGGLTPERIAREVLAAGVAAVALVHDPAEGLDLSRFPPEVTRHARDDLISVQERLSKIPGVTVLLYVQTCAAEKRRRRRAGRLADPDLRVMIDPDVCEGCGDCGVQSNCVAILPLETELGRKRQIDQSACNKDVSCLKGFCPAFVTVAGARPRRPALADLPADQLPDPVLPAITGTTNLVLTGIGGTGVVTIGAVLAMAAHLDGKAAGMIEMAGMAQKGGAVTIHCRIAERPEDIAAVRVSVGECDLLLGGDLVVSAGPATLSLLRAGRTRAVLNGQETPTGAFTRDRDFRLPMAAMTDAIARRVGAGLRVIDAGALALRGLGDSLFANMVLLGAAWQMALVPLSREAIAQAIRLNGAAVETNLAAFALGRLAAAAPDRVAALIRAGTGCATLPLEARIERLAGLLATYQDGRMADRYRAFVRRFADPELRAAVAEGYHRVLYVKDEYEVARLLAGSAARAQALFEGDLRLTWHLAPPFLPGRGPDGRPRKRAFGAWMAWVFPWLARGKRLRGTPLDPFGWTAERRADRRFAATYEADMEEVLRRISPETRAAALALARLPCDIRGFGPVRAEALARATLRREELLARLRGQGPALPGPEPQATAACAAV